ncbi:hypothetical protein Scep_022008 [Stephania cephalantha]|uniref:Uncharacterized protein n=1 Tax=Stephania cephalantha TaxID=152367 RepID=A0AAP0I2A9_9MAGN
MDGGKVVVVLLFLSVGVHDYCWDCSRWGSGLPSRAYKGRVCPAGQGTILPNPGKAWALSQANPWDELWTALDLPRAIPECKARPRLDSAIALGEENLCLIRVIRDKSGLSETGLDKLGIRAMVKLNQGNVRTDNDVEFLIESIKET